MEEANVKGSGEDPPDPNDVWTSLYKDRRECKFKTVKPKALLSSSSDGDGAADLNQVRIVCMSDTHSRLDHFKHPIPNGDIFIHAGDFTTVGSQEQVVKFNEFLGQLPHSHKLVIAGNHETTFDPRVRGKRFQSQEKHNTAETMSDLLTNCTYLQDFGIEIQGIKFYGSPWTPDFSYSWAFNASRGSAIRSKWDQIPDDTDVLITHGPPLGHLDRTDAGKHVGCEDLMKRVVTEIKPKFHIFGHIHEGTNQNSISKPNEERLGRFFEEHVYSSKVNGPISCILQRHWGKGEKQNTLGCSSTPSRIGVLFLFTNHPTNYSLAKGLRDDLASYQFTTEKPIRTYVHTLDVQRAMKKKKNEMEAKDPGIVSNGLTVFINASTCNRTCKPINPPIVFDLTLPVKSEKSIRGGPGNAPEVVERRNKMTSLYKNVKSKLPGF
eukprot:TCALIF_13913-PA protein Name:"Similar to MPPED1 Metallophosphoesterase domain-containing protein 1 (Homo sapiens)" AED:0.11 eAED:0.11 QI:0/0.33/0.25/0.75/1/1/4/317/435